MDGALAFVEDWINPLRLIAFSTKVSNGCTSVAETGQSLKSRTLAQKKKEIHNCTYAILCVMYNGIKIYDKYFLKLLITWTNSIWNLPIQINFELLDDLLGQMSLIFSLSYYLSKLLTIQSGKYCESKSDIS